jgi:hypothetical protein
MASAFYEKNEKGRCAIRVSFCLLGMYSVASAAYEKNEGNCSPSIPTETTHVASDVPEHGMKSLWREEGLNWSVCLSSYDWLV